MNWPFQDRTGGEVSPYAQPPEPQPDTLRDKLADLERDHVWVVWTVTVVVAALFGLFLWVAFK